MNTSNNISIQVTLEKVKARDNKLKKTSHNMMIIYLIGVIIYIGIFVINPDPDFKFSERISGLFYIIGFIILGLYFRYYKRMISNLDYTLPLISVIKQAERRYYFYNKNLLWLLLAVLIIGIGVVISVQKRLPDSLTTFESSLIVSISYLLIISISFIFGKIRWRKTEKPIWLKLRQALKE